MVETERNIEGGIAEPGAFGVEEHRPELAIKDVLRAHVAVNQRAFGRKRCPRERLEARRQRRVGAAGRAEIGLDADRLERAVVGERCRNAGIGRASRMDDGEVAPDRGGEIRLDAAGEKLRLP